MAGSSQWHSTLEQRFTEKGREGQIREELAFFLFLNFPVLRETAIRQAGKFSRRFDVTHPRRSQ